MLAWGWAMVFVVLLSAAPTGGAPRTALIGSAFDPATVHEVLDPKRSRLSSAAETARKKRDAGLPLGASLPAAAARSPSAAVAYAAPAPAWLHRTGSAAPLQRTHYRAHAPRAPPRA